MTKTHHTLAALTLSPKVPLLITQCQTITEGVAASPLFTSLAALLTAVNGGITGLVAAEATAMTRVKGAAQARDLKRDDLKTLMHQLKADVQKVADADPANAETIILSARMAVRKPTTRSKATFVATRGTVSGSAKLVVKAAAGRASYEWQYSTDGKTWTNMPVTLKAKTTIEGLIPGTTYSFRYRAVTKAGEGDWSAIANLVMS